MSLLAARAARSIFRARKELLNPVRSRVPVAQRSFSSSLRPRSLLRPASSTPIFNSQQDGMKQFFIEWSFLFIYLYFKKNINFFLLFFIFLF